LIDHQEVMGWLYKNSNPFRATSPDFKTDPNEREYFDIGYGLAFFLGNYDGKGDIKYFKR